MNGRSGGPRGPFPPGGTHKMDLSGDSGKHNRGYNISKFVDY